MLLENWEHCKMKLMKAQEENHEKAIAQEKVRWINGAQQQP